jgi:type I restriction enzyme S subunit
MAEENKIPDIRFKGFSGTWGERGMLDCSSKIGDGLHGTPKYVDDSGIYFINGNNLISGSIYITNETKQVNEKSQSKDDNALDFNTILMSINGTIGNLAWYQGEKVMLGKSVAYITLENCDNAYMYVYLQTTRTNNYFLNNLTGSTIKNLGLKTIRETKILIPENSEEQTKIGNYFQQLDTLITLHQRKHDKLLNVKKAMLEKMFPKKGADVPDIRFKGFSEKWEERTLKSIFNKIRNAFVGTATPYYVDKGHFYLESNNVKNGQINRNSEIFINDEFYKKQADKWLHTGDIVMVQSGHVGHTAVIPPELNNTAAHALIIFTEPKEKINPYFLNYQFKTVKSKNNLLKITTGNTIKHILSSEMKEFNVFIPEYEEQTKIGNFFKNLDTLLTLHQSELEKLKNIKKACLEKMFV